MEFFLPSHHWLSNVSFDPIWLQPIRPLFGPGVMYAGCSHLEHESSASWNFWCSGSFCKKGEDPPISVPKYLTELCFQHEVSFPGTVVSHLSHVLGTGAVMKSGNGWICRIWSFLVYKVASNAFLARKLQMPFSSCKFQLSHKGFCKFKIIPMGIDKELKWPWVLALSHIHTHAKTVWFTMS